MEYYYDEDTERGDERAVASEEPSEALRIFQNVRCVACGGWVTAFELQATTSPESVIGRPMCSDCVRHGGYVYGWADVERRVAR